MVQGLHVTAVASRNHLSISVRNADKERLAPVQEYSIAPVGDLYRSWLHQRWCQADEKDLDALPGDKRKLVVLGRQTGGPELNDFVTSARIEIASTVETYVMMEA